MDVFFTPSGEDHHWFTGKILVLAKIKHVMPQEMILGSLVEVLVIYKTSAVAPYISCA